MPSVTFRSRRARRWFERLDRSSHMLWLIGTLSFLETIVLPIPIEVVLVPLMALHRERIWQIATATTGGNLLASLLGYGVGMALYQSVGVWFIETLGYEAAFDAFRGFFARHGFVAILVVGVLPIPFQVAMITAGVSGYPVHLFVLAAVIARGLRYYGLGWLVWRYGRAARELWRRHAVVVGLGAAVLVVAVYVGGRMAAERLL
ncbi:MAG: YqaA family protein [Pseudomonadota bacterium]